MHTRDAKRSRWPPQAISHAEVRILVLPKPGLPGIRHLRREYALLHAKPGWRERRYRAVVEEKEEDEWCVSEVGEPAYVGDIGFGSTLETAYSYLFGCGCGQGPAQPAVRQDKGTVAATSCVASWPPAVYREFVEQLYRFLVCAGSLAFLGHRGWGLSQS